MTKETPPSLAESLAAAELLWENGMELSCQHFQALQEHCNGVSASLCGFQPHFWGAWDLELTITADSVAVAKCTVFTEAGTLVVRKKTATIQPLGLKGVDVNTTTLDVWLAIPRFSEGQPNLREPEGSPGRPYRYVADSSLRLDDNFGKEKERLRLRRLDAFLESKRPDASIHEGIQLARLVRDSAGGTFALDNDFSPAVLRIGASKRLTSIIEDLHKKVRNRYLDLQSELQKRADPKTLASIGSQMPILHFQAASRSLALLRQLEKSPDLHPFVAYRDLCHLFGDLAIMNETFSLPELTTAYCQEAAGAAFAEIRDKAAVLLRVRHMDQVSDWSFVRQSAPDWFTSISPDQQPALLGLNVPDAVRDSNARIYLAFETELKPDTLALYFTKGLLKLLNKDTLSDWDRDEGWDCELISNDDLDLHPVLKKKPGHCFFEFDRGRLAATADDPVSTLILGVDRTIDPSKINNVRLTAINLPATIAKGPPP